MSKTSSKDLFHLIKSLSKSEKRHFKIFTSKHVIGAKNKYVQLFEDIEKQKAYDEKKLQKRGMSSKQLVIQKIRLYEIILKSLDAYHANDSIDTQLQRQMHYIRILADKGLYQQCKKIIASAKFIAEKHEKYTAQLDIVSWEFLLIREQSYFGKEEGDIQKMANRVFKIIEIYRQTNKFKVLGFRMFVNTKHKGEDVRKSSEIKKYKNILDTIRSQKINTLSFQEKLYYYALHNTYFSIIGDMKHAYLYSSKLVKLSEKYPHLLTDNMDIYTNSVYNLMRGQLHLKKYEEMARTIEKLRLIHTNSIKQNNHLFYVVNSMELTMYITIGEFDKGILLVKKIEDAISVGNVTISNKEKEMILYYEFCFTYFGAGKYAQANQYLHKILNEPIDIRNDLQCFARILSLIIHFELGNQDLLEYTVLSTYRFLKKRNRLYQFESIVLTFIRKELPKINPDTSEVLSAFKKLKIELEEVIKNPFERKALEYFDFISWLESKIEGRAFAEVVREKAEKGL